MGKNKHGSVCRHAVQHGECIALHMICIQGASGMYGMHGMYFRLFIIMSPYIIQCSILEGYNMAYSLLLPYVIFCDVPRYYIQEHLDTCTDELFKVL